MINRDDKVNKLFGERLREERRARRLSQHKLWLISGINTSQIGKIERGVGNPSLATVVALAKALELSLDILIPLDRILQSKQAS